MDEEGEYPPPPPCPSLFQINSSPKMRSIIFPLLLFLFAISSSFCLSASADHQQSAEHVRHHKQIVHIGLVYQNYARSKVYDKAFKESIRNINSGQSITALRKLPAKFTLAPVDCVLPRGRFFPSHVLNCLCGVMVANRVALIVFVTASEEFDQSTAAAQYFLHMAAQTDIPIVAWNADNAGFTFSKLNTCWLHLRLVFGTVFTLLSN